MLNWNMRGHTEYLQTPLPHIALYIGRLRTCLQDTGVLSISSQIGFPSFPVLLHCWDCGVCNRQAAEALNQGATHQYHQTLVM